MLARLPSATRSLAVCALVTALCAASARADSPSDSVVAARQLIENAEFERALKVIDEALAQAGSADPAFAQLIELQGTTYLYLGREDRARQCFERLLQAAPDYEPARGASPKIRSLFDSVKNDLARRQRKPAPKLAHDPPSAIEPGKPLEIEARADDVPSGAKARLLYRRSGEGPRFNSATLARASGDRWAAQIPAFELPEKADSYSLEYYLEVVDPGGKRLAALGGPLDPVSVPVALDGPTLAPGTAEKPWYGKWWVWAIAGGVAAAGTAAIAIPLMLDEPATVPVTVKLSQ